jgi:hypothetical protein
MFQAESDEELVDADAGVPGVDEEGALHYYTLPNQFRKAVGNACRVMFRILFISGCASCYVFCSTIGQGSGIQKCTMIGAQQ